MKKQGFTLIELMVVIVIMGILAAVAVPKLFAQIDKSKASEVGPAAGSYVHDQDAYVVDQATLGSFKLIGWEAPTSNYFTYTSSLDGTSTGDAATWTATKKDKGPNCATAWTITSNKDTSNPNKANHQAAGGCDEMTPNFKYIGSSGT